MLTKLFYHTGTTSPTDIGPATNGVLHSLTVLSSGGNNLITVKDGGSSGTIVLEGNEALLFQVSPLRWQGIKLDGQLNIALADASVRIIVEMSELL
jgi:hypothetical protein